MITEKQHQKFRAREELKIRILLLVNNYNSQLEPEYGKATKGDITHALSSVLANILK